MEYSIATGRASGIMNIELCIYDFILASLLVHILIIQPFNNCYLYTVPRITIYNITVLESAGTVAIPINRTGGDLSRTSAIRANSRDVPGQAVGEYIIL